MTKIAIIIDNFIKEGYAGGAGTVAYILANKLNKLGYNVCVFTTTIKNTNERKNIIYHKNDDNFEYSVKRFDSIPNALGYTSPKQFYKEFKNYSPDLIHYLANDVLSLWASNFSKKNKIPSVYTHQTRINYIFDLTTPFKRNNLLHKIILHNKRLGLRKIVSNTDTLTAVSETAVQDLSNFVKGGVQIKSK